MVPTVAIVPRHFDGGMKVVVSGKTEIVVVMLSS
jgi:hypothetical protein